MKNQIKFLKQDKRPGHGGEGQYTKSGFLLKGYLIPNVDMFRVLDSETDKILMEIGILRNLITKYLYKEYQNGPVNNYIKDNLDRLHKLAQQGKEREFSKLTKLLETRSKAFMSMALFKTEPFWYKCYPASTVIHWLKDYWNYITGEYPEIALTYRRVWIPKPDGTKRPLSVPPVPWRMILVLKYLWIKIWISGKKIQIPGQYGIGTNLGLRKAWDAIMEKIDSNTIYEFDLEKFYDNVLWQKYYQEITELEIPTRIRMWMIQAIHNSQMARGQEKLLEDQERLSKIPTIIECIKSLGIIAGIAEWLSRRALRKRDLKAIKWTQENMSQESMGHGLYIMTLKKLKEINEDPKKLLEMIDSNDFTELEQEQMGASLTLSDPPPDRGLPQGISLGGFAACVALNSFCNEYRDKLIMYIDDGLLMLKEPDPFLLIRMSRYLAESGISIAPTKSGYVKRNGIWLKPLKFLGLVYDGRTGLTRASTRKGSKMEFPDLTKLQEKLEAMGYHNIRGDTMTNWWIANRLNLSDFMLAYIFNKGRLSKDSEETLSKNKRENSESFVKIVERLDKDLNRTNSTSRMIPLLKRMHENRQLWSITMKKRHAFHEWLETTVAGLTQPRDHEVAGSRQSI